MENLFYLRIEGVVCKGENDHPLCGENRPILYLKNKRSFLNSYKLKLEIEDVDISGSQYEVLSCPICGYCIQAQLVFRPDYIGFVDGDNNEI